jgi:Domain of unknown function (DUF4112)
LPPGKYPLLKPPPPPLNEAQGRLRRIRAIALLLDNAFPIPGTSYRIGIDPLLGLVPGLGDLLGFGLSVYIVEEARKLGAPPRLLQRMRINILIDLVAGTIPILGDIFDAGWKANSRNLALLEEFLEGLWKEGDEKQGAGPEVLGLPGPTCP